MTLNGQTLSLSLFLIAAAYTGMGLLVWSRRPGLAITSFAWTMFSLAVWSMGYGLEFLTPLLSRKMTWASLEFLGIASVAVFIFHFSVTYTGRRSLLTPANRVLLWVIPVITIILAWTNPYHHLIWRRSWIEVASGVEVFVAEFGTWFWLQILFSYLLLFVGFGLLILEMIRSPMPYRLRAGILLVGTAFPWIGSLLYLSESFLPGVDLTLFFFLPTSLLMAWGILRYHLLGILPMAPAMVLHDMDDGILVVDARQRILYLNRAVAGILGIKIDQALGQPLESLLPDIADMHLHLVEQREPYLEREFMLNGASRTFDVRLSQMSAEVRGAKSGEKGGLMVFRDIHRRKQAEVELQNREAILGAINLAAQQFLRTTSWESNIPAFLERLGQAVGSGRTFIFQNYCKENGQLHTRQTYEWTAHGISAQLGNRKFQNIPITQIGPEPWSAQLHQRKLVTATTSQMLVSESQEMVERKVLSTTLVPIFVEGQWWGILGMEDYAHERTWETAELEALRAAADIVGAAEIRVRNEAALQSRQRALSLQHEIVVSALQSSDLETMAQNLVDRLTELVRADGCLVTLWDAKEKRPKPLGATGRQQEIYQAHPLLYGKNTLTSKVLKSGSTLVIEDTADQSFRKRHSSPEFPFRSALILPLIAGKNSLGAIHLVYESLHRFQEQEITSGEQAAGLIALALEKFQAVEDASRRAEASETIRMASASVVETLRSEEAVDRILEQLLHVVPYDSASVQLIRDNELEIVGGRGWDDPNAIIGLRFPVPGDNPNTVVIQTGTPKILHNAGEVYEAFREGPHSHIRSWLGVPLIVSGQTIGLLAIDSKHQNFFTTEHINTVSTFADHVAIALENARLFETSEKNTRQQSALLLLSAELSAALTEAEIYRIVTRGLHSTLGYDHVGIFAVEEVTGDRVLQASIGWPDAPDDWRIPVGQGVTENSIRDGQLHYYPDVSKEPSYIPGIGGSEVNIPIWMGDKIGAVMSVEDKQTFAFKQDDLDLLSVAANLTGLALTRGRLFSIERNQYEELAVFHAIALAVSEAADENQLLEHVTQVIGENLFPDNFGILMVDEALGEFKVHSSYHINRELLGKETITPLDQGVVGHVFETGMPENLADVASCSYYLNIDSTTRSELAVPLRLGKRVIGVINAESTKSNAFSDSDERLLTTLAGQLATAIDRLRTTEMERQRSTQLAHSNALIEALGQVAARISSASDLDGVLDTLGKELQKLHFTCLVALTTADHQKLAIRYTSMSSHLVQLYVRVSGYQLGEFSVPIEKLAPHVDLTKRPMPMLLADPIAATADLLGGIPHEMIARTFHKYGLTDDARVGHFPLMMEEKAQGFLWLWGENLHEQDLLALSIFANQVAIAVENARLFEETQKRLREQTILREAGTIISSALDLNTILSLLCAQLGQGIDTTSAYINKYYEENSDTVVIAEYFSPNACTEEMVSDLGVTYSIQQTGKRFLARIKAGKHEIAHNDDRNMPKFDSEHMQQHGVKSILYIPLLVKDQLIGFAELWESRYKREFSTEEINICFLLAQQAAIAIENASLFEEVQNLALTDELTGLYNRRGLFEIGRIEFARARRLEKPFSAIMVDIDHFKDVNDDFGHPVGDKVLQRMAGVFQQGLRSVDLVGRFGGEEFVILLSETDSTSAKEVAERLRIAVEQLSINIGKKKVSVTISVGVASFDKNSPDLNTLVARADQAMYVSKHKGRNRVSIAH